MLSQRKVMKAKSLLSTTASIAATAMVIRTIANDFIPVDIMDYFSFTLHNLTHHFLSFQLTIVIEEFRGLAVNQVFEAVDIYLGSKITTPSSIQRIKIGKSEKENNLALSTTASIAATAMVIRTIANDFIPVDIMDYFSFTLHNLTHHFLSSQLTIVIEEFRGLAINQVFEAADIYLGSKITTPSSIQRIKIGKCEKENNLALSMDRDGILVDVYENVEMKCVDI